MTRFLILLTMSGLVASCAVEPNTHAKLCQPLGMDKIQLFELRDDKFKIADADKRETFAIDLLDCLGDPDPELRDKIGYEGYAALLRNKSLSAGTVNTLRQRLAGLLQEPTLDTAGFEKPFAALALSEVVRVDRITPIFTEDERRETVEVVSDYLRGITDYRGYDNDEGWRHGVAHTADVMLQLTLNPAVTPEDVSKMRGAIESQIVAKNAHSYIFGEPERLARPVLFMARRDVFTSEDWSAWFTKLADPAPLENWNDAYGSEAGLAKLHNTKAFVNAIYINANNSKNSDINAFAEPALEILKKLP